MRLQRHGLRLQTGRRGVKGLATAAKRRVIIALRAGLKGSEGPTGCGDRNAENCLLTGRESTFMAISSDSGATGSLLCGHSSLGRSKGGRSGGRNRSLAVSYVSIIFGGGRATLLIRSLCSGRYSSGSGAISSSLSGGRSCLAVFSPVIAMTISPTSGPSGRACRVTTGISVYLQLALPASRRGSGRRVCRRASITATISCAALEVLSRPIRCPSSRTSTRRTSSSATTVSGLAMYCCPMRSQTTVREISSESRVGRWEAPAGRGQIGARRLCDRRGGRVPHSSLVIRGYRPAISCLMRSG